MKWAGGRELRDEGQALVESTNQTWVKTLRDTAIEIAKEKGTVTSDDLRRWADSNGYKPQDFCTKCTTGGCERVHENSWGAVFVVSRTVFVWTGEYKQSDYTTNRARDIKIWKLGSTGGKMTTASLFKLKKKTALGQCEAMRCEDASSQLPGDLWVRQNVSLCPRHAAMAIDFAEKNPDYSPVEQLEPVVIPKVDGVMIPPSWLGRVLVVIEEIRGSEKQADEILDLLKQGLVINSQALMEEVADWVRDVKTRRDEIESKEKEVTTPLTTVIRRIRDLVSPAKRKWAEAELALRKALTDAVLVEEQRNKQLAVAAAKAHAEGGDATEAVSKMTTSTDLSGVSFKIVWRPVVKDVKLLPAEYTIVLPNEKMLKEYAASFGGEEPTALPGVVFERDAPPRVMSK